VTAVLLSGSVRFTDAASNIVICESNTISKIIKIEKNTYLAEFGFDNDPLLFINMPSIKTVGKLM